MRPPNTSGTPSKGFDLRTPKLATHSWLQICPNITQIPVLYTSRNTPSSQLVLMSTVTMKWRMKWGTKPSKAGPAEHLNTIFSYALYGAVTTPSELMAGEYLQGMTGRICFCFGSSSYHKIKRQGAPMPLGDGRGSKLARKCCAC